MKASGYTFDRFLDGVVGKHFAVDKAKADSWVTILT
jgi:hypothetical protein